MEHLSKQILNVYQYATSSPYVKYFSSRAIYLMDIYVSYFIKSPNYHIVSACEVSIG